MDNLKFIGRYVSRYKYQYLMGIIVLFIAILPQFAIAGRQMFFAEAPGPTEDKFTPRIKNTLKRGVYLLLWS